MKYLTLFLFIVLAAAYFRNHIPYYKSHVKPLITSDNFYRNKIEDFTNESSTLTVMKKLFPEDYATISENSINYLKAGKSDKYVVRYQITQVAQFIKSKSSYIRKMPVTLLEDTVKLSIMTIGHVYRNNTINCHLIFSGKSRKFGSRKNVSLYFISKIARNQILILLNGIKLAMESPVDNGVASQRDWDAVYDRMVKEGAPKRYMNVMRSNVVDNNYCPANSFFLNTLLKLEGELRARILSDYVANKWQPR